MQQPNQDDLCELLLRTGISPRHARRLATEYAEHFDDLVSELGPDSTAARARLGSEVEFVARAAARPELRAWSARWPGLVFGLGPCLAYVIAVVGVIISIVALGQLWKSSPWFIPLAQEDEIVLFTAVFTFLTHGVPVLAAIGSIAHAYQCRRWSGWTTVGVLAVCLFGSLMDFGIRPAAPPASELLVWFGWSEESTFDLARTMQWLVVSCLVVGPPALWVRRATARGAI